MGTFVVVVIILAIVGLLVWQFSESKRAASTVSMYTSLDRQKTAELINSSFRGGTRSVLWADASGPGTINKRRRGKDKGITMSIDIEAAGGGGTRVEIWASSYTHYFGFFINFAGVVNRRKKAIAQLLGAS